MSVVILDLHDERYANPYSERCITIGFGESPMRRFPTECRWKAVPKS